MVDFTPGLGGALSGVLNGLIMRRQQNAEDAKMGLEKAKTQREGAKSDAEMSAQGFKYNGDSGKYEIDPDFYTPPGSVSPEAMNSLGQAQTAAAAGGAANPGAPDPSALLNAATAATGAKAAPQGNPSYLRAQRVTQLKAEQNPKYMQNPPSIRTAWQLANPGQPVPQDLQGPLGDQDYHQDLNPLLTRKVMSPDLAPADEAATRALEIAEGRPAGTLKGISKGKVASGSAYVAGQAGANARAENSLAVHKGISDADLEQRKALALQNSPENKRFSDKYTDYVSGDREASMGVIRDMEEVRDKLRARGDGSWQSYAPGLVPFADKDLESIKTDIQNAAGSGLKDRFGGRISNLELQNALRFSYNPHLTESQNADLIDRRIRTAKEKLATKDQWANYFQQNKGNMKGYTGVGGPSGGDSGDENLGPDTGPPPDRRDLYKKAAQTGGAAVNGSIIPKSTLDTIKSMPTKGTASAPKDGAVMKSPKDGKFYKRRGGQWFPVKPGEATE